MAARVRIVVSITFVVVCAVLLQIKPGSAATEAATPYRAYLPAVFVASGAPVASTTPTSTATTLPSPTVPPTSTLTPTALPSPTFTPTPCNGWTQVLANPSFETGIAPWSLLFDVWRSSLYSFDGLYSVGFGGLNSDAGQISQTQYVPSWTNTGAVYFTWLMYSTDSLLFPFDGLVVSVFDPSNNMIASTIIDNTDVRGSWEPQRLVIPNAQAYADQPLSVAIAGFTDSSYPTTWYVDKVWMVFACGSTIAGSNEFSPFTVGTPSRVDLPPPIRSSDTTERWLDWQRRMYAAHVQVR